MSVLLNTAPGDVWLWLFLAKSKQCVRRFLETDVTRRGKTRFVSCRRNLHRRPRGQNKSDEWEALESYTVLELSSLPEPL